MKKLEGDSRLLHSSQQRLYKFLAYSVMKFRFYMYFKHQGAVLLQRGLPQPGEGRNAY